MQGLQIFNEQGRSVFDSSTKTFKVLKQFKYRGAEKVRITHPLLLEQQPICIISPPVMGAFELLTHTVSGRTMTININNRPPDAFLQTEVNFIITVGVW